MDHERAIQSLAVESYLLDEMTPAEREAFEEHFFECPACAADVRGALQFMADAPEALKSDPPSVRTIAPQAREPKRRWLDWLHPQAAAAMIGLLATACLVETIAIPNLWRRLNETSAPRVAASAFLKPQTRGTPTILKVAAGQPIIIMFDPPESSANMLEFVLKSADGSVEFQLFSNTPPPGEQVTLSLPKLDAPPGSYILVVNAPAAAGKSEQELGRYPFELQRT